MEWKPRWILFTMSVTVCTSPRRIDAAKAFDVYETEHHPASTPYLRLLLNLNTLKGASDLISKIIHDYLRDSLVLLTICISTLSVAYEIIIGLKLLFLTQSGH